MQQHEHPHESDFHTQLTQVTNHLSEVLERVPVTSLLDTIEQLSEGELASPEVPQAPFAEALTELGTLVELVSDGNLGREYHIVSGNSGIDDNFGVVATRTVFERSNTQREGQVYQLVVFERNVNQSLPAEERFDAQTKARMDLLVGRLISLRDSRTEAAATEQQDIVEHLARLARQPIEVMEIGVRSLMYEKDGTRFVIAGMTLLLGIRLEVYAHGRVQAFPVFYPDGDGRHGITQYALPLLESCDEKPDVRDASPAVRRSVYESSSLHTVMEGLSTKNIGYRP